MRQPPSPGQQDSSTGHVTEPHEVLEGMVKVLRTLHSRPAWQMSCRVKEEQRYVRKSLRTRFPEEAKQPRTRLRNGEMIFSKTG